MTIFTRSHSREGVQGGAVDPGVTRSSEHQSV